MDPVERKELTQKLTEHSIQQIEKITTALGRMQIADIISKQLGGMQDAAFLDLVQTQYPHLLED